MKTTEYIENLRAQSRALTEQINVLQQKRHKIHDEICDAVYENILEKYSAFKEGEKVRVTYRAWHPIDGIISQDFFFRKPSRIPFTLSRDDESGYEIHFGNIKKDGSESRKGTHVYLDKLISIEKI